MACHHCGLPRTKHHVTWRRGHPIPNAMCRGLYSLYVEADEEKQRETWKREFADSQVPPAAVFESAVFELPSILNEPSSSSPDPTPDTSSSSPDFSGGGGDFSGGGASGDF